MTPVNSQLPEGKVFLSLHHVRETLSAWTGIPAERLTPGRLTFDASGLAQAIGQNLYGQQHAIDAAVLAIQRRFQLPEREGVRRPIWTALFAGPSGVGKTQLARELAAHFFGNGDKHLIKIDLSEFREEHTVARLVGAPPGYKGHGDGGELTNALRRCPSGVLLLDEVEKVHRSVLTTVVLPMIGDGVVHDMNDGRTLDVTNMIVALTSNIGTNHSEEKAAGFTFEERCPGESEDASIHSTIRSHFPKEVLGRIDDVIVFAPLSEEAVQHIWRREISALEKRLAARGDVFLIDIDPQAETLLLKQIQKTVRREGARAVLRFFDRAVVDRCLDLLRDRTHRTGTIRIESTQEGGLCYRLVDNEVPAIPV